MGLSIDFNVVGDWCRRGFDKAVKIVTQPISTVIDIGISIFGGNAPTQQPPSCCPPLPPPPWQSGCPQMPQMTGNSIEDARLMLEYQQRLQEYMQGLYNQGAGGTSSTSGVSGTSGTSGVSGSSGTSGSSGSSGTAGSSGSSGTAGSSGSGYASSTLNGVSYPKMPAMTGDKAKDDQAMLQYQEDLQRYNRMFEMLSKAMQADHDTKKAILQNWRV